MLQQTSLIVAILLDAAVFLAVLSCVILSIVRPSPDSVERGRLATFRFFTTDSNILNALSCLAAIPALIAAGNGATFPHALMVFRFAGTAAVLLTMLVVMVFLGPTQGYGRMLGGRGLWVHLLCPVMALAEFLIIRPLSPLAPRDILWGVLPAVLYGLIYLYQVVFRTKGGWEDFYGFNRGGKWPVSLVAVLLGAALISTALYFL